MRPHSCLCQLSLSSNRQGNKTTVGLCVKRFIVFQRGMRGLKMAQWDNQEERKQESESSEMKGSQGCRALWTFTVEEATSFAVVSQRETPTHLLHDQAVPLKCQHECSHSDDYSVISVKCTQRRRCDRWARGHDRQYKHEINKNMGKKKVEQKCSCHSANKDVELEDMGAIVGKVDN